MKIEINIPEGYEIDKENSTWDNILLKEKVKYKIGDWVKVKDGKIVEITSSHWRHEHSSFGINNSPYPYILIQEKDIERLATEQEIKEAEWKPGELYWVKRGIIWCLRYSGNRFGQFCINQLKSGETESWKEFQLAEGVSLPS